MVRWSPSTTHSTVVTVRDRNGFGTWAVLGIAVAVGLLTLGIGVAVGPVMAPPADGRGPAGVPDHSRVAGAVVERRSNAEPGPTDHLVVVKVAATACGARSSGTGVLVDDDLLVTAAHVVGDAGLVRVDHGLQVLTGEVLGVVRDGRDLALIELDASMVRPLPPARTLGPAAPITLVGHPDGGPRTVVVGPRTAVPQLASRLHVGELLAVAAPVPPGMSGAPAVDAAGDLVGIAVAEETGTRTAIVTRIPDPGALADAELEPGRCPVGA